MEGKSTGSEGQSLAKTEKQSTGSSNVLGTSSASGGPSHKDAPPQKKKIKLDRSGLASNVAKPKSLSISNGVKTDLKSHLNEQKFKQDGIKSPIKSSKDGIKSPVKSSPSKPPSKAYNDADDDIPLVARVKTKDTSPLKSPSRDSSTNGDVLKPKSSLSKTALKSPTKQSDGHIKKLKTSGSSKVDGGDGSSKVDAVKNMKKDSSLSSSSKVDGVKKVKSSDSSSSKVEKKIKSESSKTDSIKKLKSPDGKQPSLKVDGVKKTGDGGSSKLDSIKKIKSESSSSSSSPKVDNIKKEKSLSSSPKVSEVKKEKSEVSEGKKPESGSSSSSKVDGIKKEKSNSSSSKDGEVKKKPKSETSKNKPKKEKSDSNETKKKTGSESSSTLKSNDIKKEKSEVSSSKVDGVTKKVKSESHPAKVDGVKKKAKSESSSSSTKIKSDHSSSLKVDGVKKEKSESSSIKGDGVVKKVKPEGGSASKTPDGIKKIKSETKVLSSASPKVDKIKKEKSEIDVGKKRKSDNERSSSPVKKLKIDNQKVDAAASKTKSSTEDSEDDMPLAARASNKVKKEPKKSLSPLKENKRKLSDDDDDDDDDKPLAKRKSIASGKSAKKEKTKPKAKVQEKKETGKKEVKAKKPEEEVWKWWEEEKHPEGVKWLTLEHKGPYFPPAYEPLPDSVKFYYDGKKFKLSAKSEEVAGFYAKMLDHEYTSKKIFQDNFFEDWRKEMNDEERKLIKDLSKCGFQEIHAYYVQKNEERKNMSKEEKQKIKEKNEAILQEYGYCMMDNHKERVGNFKIEPPGLFRGRGDHPKQGKLKKRVKANEVIINIAKDAKIPDPPEGQKWKAVTHDNKVTWLACWIENVQGGYKYVMLNPTSRLKGEKDWQKYETARKLKTEIGKIRADYINDWKSKEMRIRQRGVALYFIDKLALRAGHEKDEDTADTVGCCSLRVEHIKLHREKDNKENVVEFDFLGKDSIQYHNLVEVEKRVFKNLELFKQGKSDGDDLFDRLSTAMLNKYLSELMEGLSAKVFRTYNASMTLQDQLNKLEMEDNVAAKVLGYNRANRAVAILCNHQRTAPKSFEQSMSNLQQKIEDKKKLIKEAKKEVKDLKSEMKSSKTAATEKKYEKKKTALARLQEQLFKLEVTQTDKEENKEIALGTSKLNYLDPRISIAWCQKNDVPIEKIYNKTQRQKFAWAIDMTEQDFVF